MIDQTSPAEVEFFANLAAHRAREAARIERINADPRIIRLRAMKAALQTHPESAEEIMADLSSGRIARQVKITRLIRARTGQIDKNRATVQINLAEAATCRHTHWSMVA